MKNSARQQCTLEHAQTRTSVRYCCIDAPASRATPPHSRISPCRPDFSVICWPVEIMTTALRAGKNDTRKRPEARRRAAHRHHRTEHAHEQDSADERGSLVHPRNDVAIPGAPSAREGDASLNALAAHRCRSPPLARAWSDAREVERRSNRLRRVSPLPAQDDARVGCCVLFRPWSRRSGRVSAPPTHCRA